MPLRRTTISGGDLDRALEVLRADLAVPVEFPAEVLAEADASSRRPSRDGHEDATDIALVTLDPAGARDLDQAFAIARRDSGVEVTYAIADVASFVSSGGAVDAE